MSALGRTLKVGLVAGFAGYAGIWAGDRGVAPADLSALVRSSVTRLVGGDAEARPPTRIEATAATAPEGAVIYYRHPDEPAYSATPAKTPDGRDWLAVLASQDVSFDPAAKTATPVSDAAAGNRRILYYRNPMGLPDTSPTPKKDSMGMDYLPVHEGEEADGSTVAVSAGKIQRSGVKTTLAILSPISQPIVVPGVVELDERRVSVIALRTDGFVETVADVTTGAPIRAGQPLVTVYAREFAAAGAQYAADLGSGGKAGATGSLQRLLNLGVPNEMIAAIETTGKAPISVTLTAPQDGVVLERTAVQGMMAKAGETLFRIADTSTVWIIADVPEYELASVQRGAPAIMRFRSLPGVAFTGRVDEIYPEIQSETRTAKIRIELPNPERRMIAKMYADVEIAGRESLPVVAVPDSAVIDSGDRQVVIVDLGEGRFEPREVEPGQRGAGLVEIRQGVTAGDRVVVAANFLIDAESNLKAALSSFAPVDPSPAEAAQTVAVQP